MSNDEPTTRTTGAKRDPHTSPPQSGGVAERAKMVGCTVLTGLVLLVLALSVIIFASNFIQMIINLLS